MRIKIYLKMAFVVILTVILFFLIFVIYSKAGTRATFYLPEVDYVLKDENDTCVVGEELIYSDEKYNYYLSCLSSYKIYLVWNDGSKDLIKNALNSGKVTIDSLIDHGLEVVKHVK